MEKEGGKRKRQNDGFLRLSLRIIGSNEAPFLAINSPLPPPSMGIQPWAQHRWLGCCPYTQREKPWDHPRGRAQQVLEELELLSPPQLLPGHTDVILET